MRLPPQRRLSIRSLPSWCSLMGSTFPCAKNEAGSFFAQHLVRRHALDPETDADIGDLDRAYPIADHLVRDHDVTVGKRIGNEVIVGVLEERAHGGGPVLLAADPFAYVCQGTKHACIGSQEERVPSLSGPT